MLRIIDANLDRAGEGLRFLEDVARFLLDDNQLSQQLKTLRHDILRGDWPFHRQLIQSRDSESDVGINIEAAGEEKQRELPLTVMANTRRVQESLRVLEETAKIPGLPLELDEEKFKQARFALYSIEKELISKIQRRDKKKHLKGLCVVLDSDTLKKQTPIGVARRVIAGGARAILFRDIHNSKKALLPIACQIEQLCAENNALFIIDSHLDLALASGAGGLHLGQNDLPVNVVRKLLPIDTILGISVDTADEAISAESDGADYVAVNIGTAVSGLERLRKIRQAISRPVVASVIFLPGNIAELTAAGVDALAVPCTALGTEDIEQSIKQIIEGLYQTK